MSYYLQLYPQVVAQIKTHHKDNRGFSLLYLENSLMTKAF